MIRHSQMIIVLLDILDHDVQHGTYTPNLIRVIRNMEMVCVKLKHIDTSLKFCQKKGRQCVTIGSRKLNQKPIYCYPSRV